MTAAPQKAMGGLSAVPSNLNIRGTGCEEYFMKAIVFRDLLLLASSYNTKRISNGLVMQGVL